MYKYILYLFFLDGGDDDVDADVVNNWWFFLTLILTPWSENVRDKKVDSIGPGYCLVVYTIKALDKIFLRFSTMPLY